MAKRTLICIITVGLLLAGTAQAEPNMDEMAAAPAEPRMHFEVRKGSQSLDPMQFL